MIICVVTQRFTLNDFDKIKIIKRKSIDTKGSLYIGDIFECDEAMARYLLGETDDKPVVKVIEIKP